MKLHTHNFGGNVHEAATTINKWGWAEYLVSLDFNGGNYAVAVFKMPDEMVWKIREEDRGYASDPHHDDCPVDDRKPCPVTGAPCEHYSYQLDSNGEVAICHCTAPGNQDPAHEGNCTDKLCPIVPYIG